MSATVSPLWKVDLNKRWNGNWLLHFKSYIHIGDSLQDCGMSSALSVAISQSGTKWSAIIAVIILILAFSFSWTEYYILPFFTDVLSTLFVEWLSYIITLRPRQNRRHFAEDIFKCIFLNENVWIPIKISLKFVPQGPINNIPALVQIMARRRPGDKPLSGPMMVRLPTHICVTRPRWVIRRNSIM